MTNETEILKKPATVSFVENVRNFLTVERKKYPVLFTFSQKVFIPKLSNSSFNTLLTSCWYESIEGNDEIFFKKSVNDETFYKISDLPYDRCIQIELHEDYVLQTELLNCSDFSSFEEFTFELSLLLDKVKTKIKVDFSEAVYLPQFSLEPKHSFELYACINPLSEDEGRTWNNKILLYADNRAKLFHEASVLPFQLCTSLLRLV